LRSCSSPSSSGAVSGSNGFEAVSNGWYSLAIKPEKMREREEGGGITRRRKSDEREKKKNWGVKLKPILETRAERRRKHRGAELRNP